MEGGIIIEDIFTGDIFEEIQPPHSVSFKLEGTALLLIKIFILWLSGMRFLNAIQQLDFLYEKPWRITGITGLIKSTTRRFSM